MMARPDGAGKVRTESTGNHYSYRVYADPVMADRFDALRFSGPIGTLLAEEQERVVSAFLGDVKGRRILDVGTGTGRAALGLARRGALVTGIDASAEMLRVAKARAEARQLVVTFELGDAHHLTYADRSFDAAVCLRVLMHTPDWRRPLRELCRVSRDRVVVDYPSATSAAALQALGRRMLARTGRRVEAYRVFRPATIRRAFEACGFRIAQEHRQFVLPIALHKAFGSRALTVRLERALAALGLLKVFGSPITVVAERWSSS
jgi:ubiquinone/menaquinone biosynthesis C-methylase UbiE